ncbi:MAG: hypothetical protein M1821_001651 [Bathelium mastoideum]|nr:MAG: hypothetical protein M1821_001651 [Bathelium mastoideum]
MPTSKPTCFNVQAGVRIVRVGEASWVELPFTFETEGTPQTRCSGFLSTVMVDEEWKIWCLRTILEDLKEVGSVDTLEPAWHYDKGEDHDVADRIKGLNENHVEHTNGIQSRTAEGSHRRDSINDTDDLKAGFDCVVVGGGQAGLATGGRLQALDISYVILDKHPKVGDSWKTRYNSTKLHTIREYSHLPFDRTFPDLYPEYLSSDDLAKGHRDWVSKYKINIWQSTTVLSGSWDENKQEWSLKIRRHDRESFLTCSHIVFATGSGCQVPLIPTYKNRESFKGIALHSHHYKSAFEWATKSGVVIGTANTAHDIAEDMVGANLALVTMVQRSSTYVVPEEYYNDNQRRIYNAEIPTEVADRNYMTTPFAISRLLAFQSLHGRARQESERFDALEKVGFKLDRYGDIMRNLYMRSGGHYMDVGASAKIAEGLIKVKSDATPVSYTEDGLLFSNGTHLKADVIVFATGFVGNLRLAVADIFGSDIANHLDDFWGLDEEGELRGAFKPSGHPAFWYHGGTIGQSRYFSRFIALQIKAKLLGSPLHVYKDTPHGGWVGLKDLDP